VFILNNKYRVIFLLFIYPFINFDTYCQPTPPQLSSPNVNSFWISLEAGVYYLPFLLENTFSSTIDKTEPSFTTAFSVAYSLNEFHSISLGVNIFSTNITQESIHLRTNSHFRGYHINFTYYYQFNEMIANLKPYVGTGLIYSIINNDSQYEEIESQTNVWKNKSNLNGYGFEGTIGLNFKLTSTLQLSPSLNVVYLTGAGFSSSRHNLFDFSGIQILFGLSYNI